MNPTQNEAPKSEPTTVQPPIPSVFQGLNDAHVCRICHESDGPTQVAPNSTLTFVHELACRSKNPIYRLTLILRGTNSLWKYTPTPWRMPHTESTGGASSTQPCWTR
eukprot:c30270_g1_i1.p1 GENE.c30270_g1_i1~~c30270_g1_i1.p1  ORF type:complete len:107 (-),score=6.95 c30270_g1_i1:97-417(-)